jgi:aryl-alcohol dehydrogenase-like predicted oxidoreductase
LPWQHSVQKEDQQPFALPGRCSGNRATGNSRRWITREVEASLRRLGTDHVDLSQIHRPDPGTDIEETLSVLSDLISAGQIRAIGCSAFPAEQIVEAHWASVRPTAERYGMGVVTYRHCGAAEMATWCRRCRARG